MMTQILNASNYNSPSSCSSLEHVVSSERERERDREQGGKKVGKERASEGEGQRERDDRNCRQDSFPLGAVMR